MKISSALVLLALAAAGCASDDGDVDPIVTITNQWGDEADATHKFQFNSQDDGERAGTFVGEEQIANGATTYDLTGSWGNGRVVFTVARPVPVEYTAPVHEDNQSRFVFESSAGQLVLNRGG